MHKHSLLANRFKLGAILGQGGSCTVYEAQDQKLSRNVALKVVSDQLSIEDSLTYSKRLEMEAFISSSISHPNLITVYDFGTLISGSPFLVMEKLNGESLECHLKRAGRLAPGKGLEIAIQLCNAALALHSAKIIHRDIKPGNIFLLDSEHKPNLKLMDLGIAKGMVPNLCPFEEITQCGLVLGTPHFMSPEQVIGSVIDHRTDIYSIGLVIYEMLSGITAYNGDVFQVMMDQLTTTPARQPLVDLGLSTELIAIIFKCLEKDPDRRFQSASEVETALRDEFVKLY